MNKLKALEAFESEDGKFAKDEEFLVNDERAMVLTRTGKAERCADQSIAVEGTEGAGINDQQPGARLNVPRQQPDE